MAQHTQETNNHSQENNILIFAFLLFAVILFAFADPFTIVTGLILEIATFAVYYNHRK